MDNEKKFLIITFRFLLKTTFLNKILFTNQSLILKNLIKQIFVNVRLQLFNKELPNNFINVKTKQLL